MYQKKSSNKAYELIQRLFLLFDVPSKGRFPFVVPHLERYARFRAIRTLARKLRDSYAGADPRIPEILTNIDRTLRTVTKDKEVLSLVKTLRKASEYLDEAREILDPETYPLEPGRALRDEVEGQLRRYCTRMKRRAGREMDFITQACIESAVRVLERHWEGLFHAYEFEYLDATNNAMESTIGRTRRLWRKMTGRKESGRWVGHAGQFAPFLENFRKDPETGKTPLEAIGVQIVDLQNEFSHVARAPAFREAVELQDVLTWERRFRLRAKRDGIGVVGQELLDEWRVNNSFLEGVS